MVKTFQYNTWGHLLERCLLKHPLKRELWGNLILTSSIGPLHRAEIRCRWDDVADVRQSRYTGDLLREGGRKERLVIHMLPYVKCEVLLEGTLIKFMYRFVYHVYRYIVCKFVNWTSMYVHRYMRCHQPPKWNLVDMRPQLELRMSRVRISQRWKLIKKIY